MKTFRRSAFYDIPDSNFRDDEGEYIMIACDQAIFLPLLYFSKVFPSIVEKVIKRMTNKKSVVIFCSFILLNILC